MRRLTTSYITYLIQLFTTILLIAGLTGKVYSDGGNCVKYDVNILLKNEQEVRGFVYVQGYQPKFEFKDISFLEHISTTNNLDTLRVYRNIRQLPFPAYGVKSDKCEFRFEATTADNYFKILKKNIKAVEVIAYMTCGICDNPDKKDGYYWNGIDPPVITELTGTEIALLQTTPKATVSFMHSPEFEFNTTEYFMISYSSAYQQTDLEKIKNDFLTETDELLRMNKWDVVQDKYRKLKSELRKKKVIVFQIATAL